MEEIGFEVICGAPMTLVIKGEVMVKKEVTGKPNGMSSPLHKDKKHVGPM